MSVLAHSKCQWDLGYTNQCKSSISACSHSKHPLLDVHELPCVSMHKESVWQKKVLYHNRVVAPVSLHNRLLRIGPCLLRSKLYII